jgi:hypothetical protein
MNYMDFYPCLYEELRQQMLREVDSLRLNKRLRDARGSGSSRFLGFARRCALPWRAKQDSLSDYERRRRTPQPVDR